MERPPPPRIQGNHLITAAPTSANKWVAPGEKFPYARLWEVHFYLASYRGWTSGHIDTYAEFIGSQASRAALASTRDMECRPRASATNQPIRSTEILREDSVMCYTLRYPPNLGDRRFETEIGSKLASICFVVAGVLPFPPNAYSTKCDKVGGGLILGVTREAWAVLRYSKRRAKARGRAGPSNDGHPACLELPLRVTKLVAR